VRHFRSTDGTQRAYAEASHHPGPAKSVLSSLPKPSERKEKMINLRRFIRDEQGQDMVEYALLAAFISIVAIATLRIIGPRVLTIYNNVRDALV
jgi:pilus assembly protein Flp/PilA